MATYTCYTNPIKSNTFEDRSSILSVSSSNSVQSFSMSSPATSSTFTSIGQPNPIDSSRFAYFKPQLFQLPVSAETYYHHNQPIYYSQPTQDENYAHQRYDHTTQQSFSFLKRRSKQSITWSPPEDKLLRELKDNQKLGWREISSFFQNRTPNACQFRWRRIVSGQNISKVHQLKGTNEKKSHHSIRFLLN